MSFLDYLTQNEVVTRNEVPIKDKALVNQVAAATDRSSFHMQKEFLNASHVPGIEVMLK